MLEQDSIGRAASGSVESPAAEEHITLTQAAKLAPGRPSPNCVWRWCREGVKAASGQRVRLKHVRFGSRIYTTRQWLTIINLVAPSTREGLVIETLLKKLEAIRVSLGSDKVFDSIGRLFEGLSLKDYMERAVVGDKNVVARELASRLTDEQVAALEARDRMLYGDGGDVKRQLPRLREDLEREAFCRLLPGYVRQFIDNAAPLIGLKIDGDMDGEFAFVPSEPGAGAAVFHALDAYPATKQRRLTVVRPRTPHRARSRPGARGR